VYIECATKEYKLQLLFVYRCYNRSSPVGESCYWQSRHGASDEKLSLLDGGAGKLAIK